MALVPLEEVESDLISPCCRAEVAGRPLVCGKCGREFAVVGECPVLVDFDRSVLAEADVLATGAASLIDRRRGRFGISDSGNPVAERNIAILLGLLPDRGRVLVVGGGTIGKGLGCLYSDARAKVVGFDIYRSGMTQLVADAHQIPFVDGSFDAVVVQAVLEHVLDPAAVVAEIWRVLTPAGVVYAETPFLQHVHEGAYDFQRFTESGHRWLFRRFERIDSGVVAGPGYELVWSLDYAVRGLLRSRKAGLRVRKVLLPLRALDRLVPRKYAVDAASAVFFLGRRSDRELTPREIIAYCQGAQTL